MTNALELTLQAIGTLAAVVGAAAILIAARQLRFNSWLKVQEIFTDEKFVKARGNVYSKLPGRAEQSDKNWTDDDFLVCRKMDELARLAPYLGLFGSGRKLIIETWKDPLAKSWIVLRPLVKEEQERWPEKWKAFEEFGKEAAKQLGLKEEQSPCA